MSDTQPWWADVQHLRPREHGGTYVRPSSDDAAPATGEDRPIAESRPSGRFTRDGVERLAPLETAVAVAIAEELPRLDDIDWHDFVEGHADAFAGEPAPVAPARRFERGERPSTAPQSPLVDVRRDDDPLAALDWDASPVMDPRFDEFRRDPESGRRTVEIRGQVGDAATAPVPLSAASTTRGARPRPVRTAGDRFHAHPDRVALWAFLLGIVLMLVAAFSAPEADAAVRIIAG
jgi:hypothetical protein